MHRATTSEAWAVWLSYGCVRGSCVRFTWLDHAYAVCCALLTQATLTRRALELLALTPGPSQGGTPKLLLDLGCGSGLSGAEISDAVSVRLNEWMVASMSVCVGVDVLVDDCACVCVCVCVHLCQGHIWVGTDIAPAMLDVAQDREVRQRTHTHTHTYTHTRVYTVPAHTCKRVAARFSEGLRGMLMVHVCVSVCVCVCVCVCHTV